MRRAKILLLLLFSLNGYTQTALPNTLTASDKMYGLSKFWQEVNYNFVYLDRVNKASWDSAYRSTLQSALNTANDYGYYRHLQRLCAFLKDGHTNVYLPPSLDSLVMTTMFGDYRLFLQNIDGKAVVARVNAGKIEQLPVGSEIVEVNGKPVSEFVRENVTPLFPHQPITYCRTCPLAVCFKG